MQSCRAGSKLGWAGSVSMLKHEGFEELPFPF